MDNNNIRFRLDWSKSEDEIWNEMFEHLDEQRYKKGFLSQIPVWGYAASLLIPVLLFCNLYTVTSETARGEYSTVSLPDHSTVTMNAESKVSYKPLTWFVSRKVQLQGEAFFEVNPGRSFCVYSGQKRVKVLGTTFNVYVREGMYHVTCLSGRVEVQAGTNTTVLRPNMQAIINEPKFSINSNIAPSSITGWMNGMFVFAKTPLSEVIAEVERRYDIAVTPDYNPNRLYSGSFPKTDNPEDVLDIIGKALNITFIIKQ